METGSRIPRRVAQERGGVHRNKAEKTEEAARPKLRGAWPMGAAVAATPPRQRHPAHAAAAAEGVRLIRLITQPRGHLLLAKAMCCRFQRSWLLIAPTLLTSSMRHWLTPLGWAQRREIAALCPSCAGPHHVCRHQMSWARASSACGLRDLPLPSARPGRSSPHHTI